MRSHRKCLRVAKIILWFLRGTAEAGDIYHAAQFRRLLRSISRGNNARMRAFCLVHDARPRSGRDFLLLARCWKNRLPSTSMLICWCRHAAGPEAWATPAGRMSTRKGDGAILPCATGGRQSSHGAPWPHVARLAISYRWGNHLS